MGIGIVEIVFVVVVALVTALIVATTKHRWLVVVPAFFVVATLVSPADLVSTLLIGVPNCVLFVVAFRYFAPVNERPAGSIG